MQPTILFVVGGWYGLGNMRVVLAVARALRASAPDPIRLALLTLPFEQRRLAHLGDDGIFDAIHLCEEGAETEYCAYIARTLAANRRHFRAAIARERPQLVVTHWMMLAELIDGLDLGGARHVAILEETEWGHVVPGSAQAADFAFVDHVLFADGFRVDAEGLAPRQERVGCIAALRPPALPPTAQAAAPCIVVNSGGGAYTRTHAMLAAALDAAHALREARFRLLLGPLVPDPVRGDLAARATALPNVELLLDPPERDIVAALAHADLVVSTGGTNSLAEAFAFGKRVLVVNPNGSATENDLCRLRAFARAGLLAVHDTAEPRFSMAAAISAALAAPAPAVPADGAQRSAAALRRMLADDQGKALAAIRFLLVLLLPGVTPDVAQQLIMRTRSAWRVVPLSISPLAGEDAILRRAETARFHDLHDFLSSTAACEIAMVAQGPIAEDLVSALMVPGSFFLLADRAPEALSRCQPGFALERADAPWTSLLPDWQAFRVTPVWQEYPPDYVRAGYNPFAEYG
ncbi:MAG: hypothetical protein E6G97_21575 [Alphaproteobacteria bacterium]|nr:MAG: hypothetical protein E6G97_21575 [Alphaproteobacteria bacterium]